MMITELKSRLRLLTMAACTPLLLAAADDTPAATPPAGRPAMAEAMKRFDADGDGRLSPAERETMRAAMRESRDDREPGEQGGRLRERAMARFDTDGDGRLNETERTAAESAMREQLANRPAAMARVDTDKDGKVSDAEWAVARERLLGRRGGPNDGQRPGPPRNAGKPPGPPRGGN